MSTLMLGLLGIKFVGQQMCDLWRQEQYHRLKQYCNINDFAFVFFGTSPSSSEFVYSYNLDNSGFIKTLLLALRPQ